MRQISNLVCAIACLLICCSVLSAQNFQANPAPSPSNSWQPPTIQYNPPPASNSAPLGGPGNWYPDEPAKQDSNVRPANVEIALPDVAHSSMNPGDAQNGPQDNTTDQPSGWLGAVRAVGPWGKSLQDKFGGVDVKKMFGSLAIVLGGYLGFVWLVRRFNSGAAGKLPAEVLDVVGTAPFGPRKNLQLVRLGSKLLLLLNGPEGTHPIGEITDPAEVEHLISLCQGRSTSKSSDRSVLKNLMGRLQTDLPPSSLPNLNGRLTMPQEPVAPTHAAANHSLPMQTAAANTTSELERIVQRLSSVVAQTNGRNVFEA